MTCMFSSPHISVFILYLAQAKCYVANIKILVGMSLRERFLLEAISCLAGDCNKAQAKRYIVVAYVAIFKEDS